jgi:hypothetical protein
VLKPRADRSLLDEHRFCSEVTHDHQAAQAVKAPFRGTRYGDVRGASVIRTMFRGRDEHATIELVALPLAPARISRCNR